MRDILENHLAVKVRLMVERNHEHLATFFGTKESREIALTQRLQPGESVAGLAKMLISKACVKVDSQLHQWSKSAGKKDVAYMVMIEVHWFRLFDEPTPWMPSRTLEAGVTGTFDPGEDDLPRWIVQLEKAARAEFNKVIK